MYNLRKATRPVHNFEYLSWPLWHDGFLKIPKIKSLEIKNVLMVTDVLDSMWNLQNKEEIKLNNDVSLNFLEYMAIKHKIANL